MLLQRLCQPRIPSTIVLHLLKMRVICDPCSSIDPGIYLLIMPCRLYWNLRTFFEEGNELPPPLPFPPAERGFSHFISVFSILIPIQEIGLFCFPSERRGLLKKISLWTLENIGLDAVSYLLYLERGPFFFSYSPILATLSAVRRFIL